jgi:hypothetical protein
MVIFNAMSYELLYHDFLKSGDSLRVYRDEKLIFASSEKMLLPLLSYIREFGHSDDGIVVFDKIAGNAAALLLVVAGCGEIYSPLGSRLAATTFEVFGIKYHIQNVVPYITRPGTDIMCPMEQRSINKTPDSFYDELKVIE